MFKLERWVPLLKMLANPAYRPKALRLELPRVESQAHGHSIIDLVFTSRWLLLCTHRSTFYTLSRALSQQSLQSSLPIDLLA